MLRTTMFVAAIALAIAPGAARAAWLPTADVAPSPYGGGYPPGLAVADDGRAATADLGRLAEIVPGRGVTAVAVPDMTLSEQVAYAPDGTFVAAGTVYSGPTYVPYDPGKAPACCTRPAIARWLPGTPAATTTMVQPLLASNYMISGLQLDGTGAAVLLAAGTSSSFEDDEGRAIADPVVAIRFPAGGAPPVQRTLGTHASADSSAPDPYALRARADGPGATVVWNGGRHRWRRIDIAGGPWRQGHEAPANGDPYGVMLLDARGRRVRFFRARHSMLSVQGRRPLRFADRILGIAEGPDGSLTLLLRRSMRLSLRTVDPNGRLGAARPLGTLGRGSTEGPFLAVDGAGHAHVAWRRPGGGTVVAGPHGRHVLPGLARALAVSPGGTVAVALRDHGMLRVAVDTHG